MSSTPHSSTVQMRNSQLGMFNPNSNQKLENFNSRPTSAITSKGSTTGATYKATTNGIYKVTTNDATDKGGRIFKGSFVQNSIRKKKNNTTLTMDTLIKGKTVRSTISSPMFNSKVD